MAYKQKGWSPFTQKNDEKFDIVIKYNKDGSRNMTEVWKKIKKEERDAYIAAIKKQKNKLNKNK